MSQIDLTGKSDAELRSIIENAQDYIPEVVKNAKATLELRKHNEEKIMAVLNECSKQEQSQSNEEIALCKFDEMLAQLKTIKKCCIFFTVLTVISMVIMIIASFGFVNLFTL